MRIVHLGLGAFHRAHQAVYLQRLHDAGDARWQLAGANLRADQPEVEAALLAQDGRYAVESVSPDAERRYEIVRSLSQVMPWSADLRGAIALGASALTRIVSFTVTEGGYYLDPHGRLDPALCDWQDDLEARRAGLPVTTLYGALAAMLSARRATRAGPVTLLSCDNVRHNGGKVRGGLLQFLQLAGDASLHDWVAEYTRWPDTMVDRITPRPPPGLRERVRAAIGIDDGAAVMAEDFMQWVIEDDFAAGRPALERVGVEFVDSVLPHEEAKIRLLNASHSAVAWAGALVGRDFIHEAVRVPAIHRLVHDYATQAVLPCLQPSSIDLATYRDIVLQRFSNVALGDRIERVAADSFSKLPGFIVPTLRETLAAGRPLAPVATLPALMLAFLQRWDAGALPFVYRDGAMDPEAARAICRAGDPVRAFCEDRGLWGDLAGQAPLIEAVRDAHRRWPEWLQ